MKKSVFYTPLPLVASLLYHRIKTPKLTSEIHVISQMKLCAKVKKLRGDLGFQLKVSDFSLFFMSRHFDKGELRNFHN